MKDTELMATRKTGWIPAAKLSPLVFAVGVTMSVYHLYAAAFGFPEVMHHNPAHIGFVMALGFILYRGSDRADKNLVPWYDLLFALTGAAACAYIFIDYSRITWRIPYLDPVLPLDYFFSVALVLLVLELARRTVGLTLTMIAVVFMLYGLFGNHFPGFLQHSGVPLRLLLDQLYLIPEGVFGMPTGVSATYVFLFIVFGAFLEKSGVGNFFMKLATSLAGWSRGGPAKIAVISSACFGTMSGSAVANVYATGVFTIPLMKKVGYRSAFAGAVEAVASTGGQIMPPVMGSAAFLMAEFTSTSYLDICVAAALPALLYYLGVMCMVHIEAIKKGLSGLPWEMIPNFRRTILRDGYLLLPVIVLMLLLVNRYTPYFAAFYAIVITVVLSMIRKETRMTVKSLFGALETAAKSAVPIACACAAAGIVVGVISLTGLGLKFPAMIMRLSGGSVLVALLLVMLITLVMGMGLPAPAVYLMVVIFAAPALIDAGIPTLASHMFTFYYASIAVITPPVALAAYAGATLAEAPLNATGWIAFRLGLAAYIVPWMFVFGPPLMLDGSLPVVIGAAFTASLGVCCLACGAQGWLLGEVPVFGRGLLVVAALGLIKPGYVTDIIGLVLLTSVLLWQLRSKVFVRAKVR